MYIGDETYLYLFNFLDITDLRKFNQTNKFFYNIVNFFIRRNKKFLFDGTLRSLQTFGKYIHQYGNVVYHKLPHSFLLYAPNAKHIEFFECNDEINFSHISRYIESLIIIDTPFYNLDISNFPHIKFIKIGRHRNKNKMGKLINCRKDIIITDSDLSSNMIQ